MNRRTMKRMAWVLWLVPAIMGAHLLFPPLLKPSRIPDVLAAFWPTYVAFFALPWAAGLWFWLKARRQD